MNLIMRTTGLAFLLLVGACASVGEAQSERNCALLEVVGIDPVGSERGVIYTIANRSNEPRQFRIYRLGIQSSVFSIEAGETKSVGVAVDQAVAGIGALTSSLRGDTGVALNDCTPLSDAAPRGVTDETAEQASNGSPDSAPDAQAQSSASANVNMRAGPGTTHRVLGLLRRGEQVRVVRAEAGWCEVASSRLSSAFVSCRYLSEPAIGWETFGGGARIAAQPPGAAPSRWDARVVFAPAGDTQFGSPADCPRECFARRMRSQRASSQALAFSDALGGDAYATEFREMGRVDLVTVSQPQFEAASIYLVNGQPDLIEADRYDLSAADRRTPALRTILAQNRGAEAWPYGEFQRVERITGGGQRFHFAAPVMACRACEPIATIEYVIDFDAAGRYLGRSLLRTSAARR